MPAALKKSVIAGAPPIDSHRYCWASLSETVMASSASQRSSSDISNPPPSACQSRAATVATLMMLADSKTAAALRTQVTPVA